MSQIKENSGEKGLSWDASGADEVEKGGEEERSEAGIWSSPLEEME